MEKDLEKKLSQFMLESNRIEDEDRINPGDLDASNFALTGIDTIQEIFALHTNLGRHLKKNWVGQFRKVDVQVGSFMPPSYKEVDLLMLRYVDVLPGLDSWEAHNRFEKIHPFRDLNGRVGRLIWLSKAVDEGYKFKMPFLQVYYYQTLNRQI